MSAADGLNLGGTVLEFIGVVVGGLALDSAAGLRERLKVLLSVGLLRLFKNGYLVGALAAVLTIPVTYLLPFAALTDAVVGVVLVATVGIAMLNLGEKLANARDETLKNVLLAMGAIFGIGVLMQAVAAFLQAT